MNLIYNAQDALFEFMQKGGDVLYLIALLAFFMWLLIFERIWYFYFIYNNELREAVDKWLPHVIIKNITVDLTEEENLVNISLMFSTSIDPGATDSITLNLARAGG